MRRCEEDKREKKYNYFFKNINLDPLNTQKAQNKILILIHWRHKMFRISHNQVSVNPHPSKHSFHNFWWLKELGLRWGGWSTDNGLFYILQIIESKSEHNKFLFLYWACREGTWAESKEVFSIPQNLLTHKTAWFTPLNKL